MITIKLKIKFNKLINRNIEIKIPLNLIKKRIFLHIQYSQAWFLERNAKIRNAKILISLSA
jgi:hypothetical protein